MKKLNNKGFLLVETVIVSIFVLTIFVLVYQNSLPMIQEYNQRIRYDSMDSVYGADLFRKLVMKDPKYSEFLSEVNTVGYKNVGDCSIYSSNRQAICQKLKSYLNLTDESRIYLTSWEIRELDKLQTLPRGYLEYVKYLKKYEQEKVTNYRLIFSHQVSYRVDPYDVSGTGEKKVENHYANIGM